MTQGNSASVVGSRQPNFLSKVIQPVSFVTNKSWLIVPGNDKKLKIKSYMLIADVGLLRKIDILDRLQTQQMHFCLFP
jgi:hypothetical protein